jgi:hypothetical protein
MRTCRLGLCATDGFIFVWKDSPHLLSPELSQIEWFRALSRQAKSDVYGMTVKPEQTVHVRLCSRGLPKRKVIQGELVHCMPVTTSSYKAIRIRCTAASHDHLVRALRNWTLMLRTVLNNLRAELLLPTRQARFGRVDQCSR